MYELCTLVQMLKGISHFLYALQEHKCGTLFIHRFSANAKGFNRWSTEQACSPLPQHNGGDVTLASMVAHRRFHGKTLFLYLGL